MSTDMQTARPYSASQPQHAYPPHSAAAYSQSSAPQSARDSSSPQHHSRESSSNGVNSGSSSSGQLPRASGMAASGHVRARSAAPGDMMGTPAIPPRTSSTQRTRNHSYQPSQRSRNGDGRDRRDRPTDDGRSRRREEHDRRDHHHSDLVTEGSRIINQLVITDPSEDIEREAARQKEVQGPFGSANDDGADDAGRAVVQRRHHDYPQNSGGRRKETTFGQYILGQTIGEGEFGKVKLGWKKDGSVQVAIKLIRRESLGGNPSRLPKIYREISILRGLSHPNIVKLHEMVETDRHIGIIMEYASGGELFDYILHNRYLKDNAARRLFAQLVSGVGYLHKKGIVHRDLKLENLLLDRNRNIIITDFGFANTFNPNDELSEEIEYNLTNKEFVKRMRLDKVDANGMRRGDLMQTSCGSPCYAAPELVVSDSLYTGRKVDVWSCGVILYAMLAGYLPFDDDPANPEGDNINLLYKYIVSTPLTFPEWVTPHARDLLRRILVPDPRKRADLFEVARHSWLAEYSHIVAHITSNTTNIADIATTTVPSEGLNEGPSLTRSASVREPPRSYQTSPSTLGGLNHHQGKITLDDTEKYKTSREAKRRTVQVEYVAPQSQTARGDGSTSDSSRRQAELAADKPSPSHAPVADAATGTSQGVPHSASESAGAHSQARPTTGHSVASLGAGRLPSQGSYGQPVAPTVAATNAQGRLTQPKNEGTGPYNISSPGPAEGDASDHSRPGTYVPSVSSTPPASGASSRGHRRSNTVSSIGEKIFGRPASIFGGRSSQTVRAKRDKKYPPTSMKEPFAMDEPRPSMDSRRSTGTHSRSGTMQGRSRRFSLLRGFSSRRSDQQSDGDRQEQQDNGRPATGPAGASMRQASQTLGSSRVESPTAESPIEPHPQVQSYEDHIDRQFAELHSNQRAYATENWSNPEMHPDASQRGGGRGYPGREEFNGHERSQSSVHLGRQKGAVLQKSNRKFADAYEYERNPGYHSGSSGAARKVMDFFRRRARVRVGDDR